MKIFNSLLSLPNFFRNKKTSASKAKERNLDIENAAILKRIRRLERYKKYNP